MPIPAYLWARYGESRGAVGDANALLRAMRSRYQAVDEEMAALLDAASKERRDLNKDERRTFDQLEDELRGVRNHLAEVEDELGIGPDSDSTSRGGSVRFYDTESGREVRGYRHGERIARDQDDAPTFGAFVAGALRSALGERVSERERRALAGATGSAGGYMVDEVLSSRFIDALRARSVVSRAGAITLPLAGNADQFHIARIDSDPTPQWRKENATVAEGDPSFSRILLQPRTLAVLTKIPVELVQDAANLESVVERSLAESVGAELDRAAMFGSGTGDEPMGFIHTQNVNVEPVSGALTSYAPFVKGLRRLEDDNVDSAAPTVAAVMSTRDWATIELLTDTTNQPLRAPRSVEQLRTFRSTKVPTDGGAGENESEITIGDWQRVLLGVRQDVQVEILRELFREKLQIGVLVWARFDVVLERGESFVRLTAITP